LNEIDLRLAVTDMPVGAVPVKIKCPDSIHKHRAKQTDKNQSLAVYPDNLHCYGCGFHRNNRLEALAFLLGVTEEEAKKVAEKYTNEALDAYRERAATEARRDPLPFALAQLYNTALMGPNAPRAHRQDWLLARGITLETAEDVHLGHDGNRYVIPIFDADMKLIALRYRRDDAYLDESYPKYMGMKGRNGLYLYPEWLIERDTRKFLVICEGELDALRLWQEGYPAVSATNGAGQAHKLPALIRERWPRIHTLCVATDQDEPGEEAARLTIAAAEGLGMKAMRLRWEEGKDVTEALQLGHKLVRDR
jgi:hypothetical protein